MGSSPSRGSFGAFLRYPQEADIQRGKQKLKVHWFKHWEAALDEALEALPEPAPATRELYRLVASNPSRTPKRIALVTQGDELLALICLRRRLRYWEPVTEGGIAPTAIMAHRFDSPWEGLRALRREIWIGSWPQEPPATAVARCFPLTYFAIDLDSDYEAYWQSVRHLSEVKKARRRFPHFELETDHPGAADWVIREWQGLWGDDREGQTARSEDLTVASEYLLRQGRLHVFRVLDQGLPVAGCTNLVQPDGSLLGGIMARNRDQRYSGVGNLLLDWAFQWARDAGVPRFDMGSAHGYKGKWAPEAGSRWVFNISPWPQRWARRLLHRARGVARG